MSRGSKSRGEKSRSKAKSKLKTKTKAKPGAQTKTTQLLKNIWPQERDFLARPERLKYVRRAVQPTTCVFCDAFKAGPSLDSLCLHVGQKAMVMLNKYPYNTGHLMVLPTRHEGDLLSLDNDEYLEVQELVRKVVGVLQKAYQAPGFNIGLNHGRVAGAGIPEHLHWHIIPRWVGDTNFFPLIAETKVLPETLEDTYRRLQKHFQVKRM